MGDWIGPFQPGHLVLTGPRLPHNWISMDMPEGGVPLRDLVIQFSHEPLVRQQRDHSRAARGAAAAGARAPRHRVFWHGSTGHRTLAAHQDPPGARAVWRLLRFLSDLARCTDYRLLSSVQLQSDDNDTQLDQINAIVSRITDHLADPQSAADLAPSWA